MAFFYFNTHEIVLQKRGIKTVNTTTAIHNVENSFHTARTFYRYKAAISLPSN